MKKLKLSPVQSFRLKEAYRHAFVVLEQIKGEKLEGNALSEMKQLEEAVQALEFFALFR